MKHTIMIPGWAPVTLNQLIGRHWRVVARLKKSDRQTVALYARDVPRATGKRRVTLRLTLAPRQRATDPDASWKVLLDSLVACGALVNDNRQNVELAPVEFVRGKARVTEIFLEDIDP